MLVNWYEKDAETYGMGERSKLRPGTSPKAVGLQFTQQKRTARRIAIGITRQAFLLEGTLNFGLGPISYSAQQRPGLLPDRTDIFNHTFSSLITTASTG